MSELVFFVFSITIGAYIIRDSIDMYFIQKEIESWRVGHWAFNSIDKRENLETEFAVMFFGPTSAFCAIFWGTTFSRLGYWEFVGFWGFCLASLASWVIMASVGIISYLVSDEMKNGYFYKKD